MIQHNESVSASIDAFITYARQHLYLDASDEDYTRNRLIELIGFSGYIPSSARTADMGDASTPARKAGTAYPASSAHKVDATNNVFPARKEDAQKPSDSAVACKHGAQCHSDAGNDVDALLRNAITSIRCAGLAEHYDDAALADALLNTVSPVPSRVQQLFAEQEQQHSAMEAMHWLYDFGLHNGYVHGGQLAKNPRFGSHGLIVTINAAKPEFKTMASAGQGNSVQGGYPACTICHANEGFAARNKRTLRTIPVELDGEPWFWQYSPYGYFHEHGICVNMQHTPMHVDRSTFRKLLDFVDRFPDFFLGCNAALPRIGGSVLAHDHYQGGGEQMPMHHAAAVHERASAVDSRVSIAVLDWPGTAMRLTSTDRDALVAIADRIRLAWEQYDNAALHIASHDAQGNRQSAVSPTVIATDHGYELSLILRNNAVSEEHPQGIFHAHEEFWPIKQEPIGLIEAQGLFVLPGRLITQLGELEQALCQGAALPQHLAEFHMVFEETQQLLQGATDEQSVRVAMRDELGSICTRILRNTAVFPDVRETEAFLQQAEV
ncbi:galactose-1-phosphate uridylyltransferase [Bifidobacterium dolichotidis]|uniref:Galactose-1-phosphate uridylyltransferase n=1 Tax=Bifidobacterium dolichotidis TaxID=2306976 RepID=A0A430FPM5_9BIFI|nr:galactose-1-phosphate uridylyltransferase [Bifidobacterium dolichotidis]RSX54787.1 galactose-1-phosphate uridylyltransferase [Bifidobacterium dolichotidis]